MPCTYIETCLYEPTFDEFATTCCKISGNDSCPANLHRLVANPLQWVNLIKELSVIQPKIEEES